MEWIDPPENNEMAELLTLVHSTLNNDGIMVFNIPVEDANVLNRFKESLQRYVRQTHNIEMRIASMRRVHDNVQIVFEKQKS